MEFLLTCFLKRLFINLLGASISILISFFLKMEVLNFYFWILKALIVGIITLIVLIIINSIFYKEDVKLFLTKLIGVFKR